MRIRVLILSFSLLITAMQACVAQLDNESCYTRNLKGKVKTLSRKSYKLSATGDTQSWVNNNYETNCRDYRILFDEKGRKIEEIESCENDTVCATFWYSYHDDGKFVKFKGSRLGDRERIYQYAFDKKGNTVKEELVTQSNAIKITRYRYTYDEKGRVVRRVEKYYRTYKSFLTYILYEMFHKKIGRSKFIYDFSYNEKDNSTVCHFYKKGTHFISTRVYKKDEKGDTIEYRFYHDAKDTAFIQLMQYNGNHRVTEMKVYNGKKLDSRQTYKYNQQGNIIENADYFPDNTLNNIQTYDYTYDAAGNWVERITYVLGVKTYKEVRTITYY